MAETSSARFQNRRAMLDKEHALNTARNPGDSKYGNALYRNNTHESRIYSAELVRIEKQLKINGMHIDQEKKQFLAKYAPREPMLIVVRPPSPKAIQKHEWIQYNAENELQYGDPRYRGGPRYMDPLKSRVRTPSYRPTIDAFCVQTRKKVNVWEKDLLDKEPPKFRSTVMPSYPLSAAEICELIKALEHHRQAMGEARRTPKQRVVRKRRRASASPASRGATATPWQFVTDVNQDGDADDHQQSDGRRERTKTSAEGTTVTFDVPDGRVVDRKPPSGQDVGQPKCSPESRTKKPVQRKVKATELRTIRTSSSNIHKKLSTSATCIVRPDPDAIPSPSHPERRTENVVKSGARREDKNHSESGKQASAEANSSKTPDKTKKPSGMKIILEAAIDGMNSIN